MRIIKQTNKINLTALKTMVDMGREQMGMRNE